MKKAFTLIEIVIALALIGLVLAMVSNMGQGFSDEIRFANTKEEVTATLQNIIQEAATTNAVLVGSGWQRYATLNVSIVSGNTIEWGYASGELTEYIVRSVSITNGIFSSSGFGLSIAPYAIGCDTSSGNAFMVTATDNGNLHACFAVNAATCKLTEVSCNP